MLDSERHWIQSKKLREADIVIDVDGLDNILPSWSLSTSTSMTMIYLTNQRPRKCDKTDRMTERPFDIMTTNALWAAAVKITTSSRKLRHTAEASWNYMVKKTCCLINESCNYKLGCLDNKFWTFTQRVYHFWIYVVKKTHWWHISWEPSPVWLVHPLCHGCFPLGHTARNCSFTCLGPYHHNCGDLFMTC